MKTITCPNCGASHYSVKYSTSTLLGWTPIYKDGELTTGNPNATTTYCTCCKCHHSFHYVEQYDKTTEIIDDGKEREVPVIEMPLTAKEGDVFTIENITSHPIVAVNPDIERLEKEIQELKASINQLKGMMIRHVSKKKM